MCRGVPLRDAPIRAAISVPGPSGRVTLGGAGEIAPVLREAAERLADGLRHGGPRRGA
jgi:IclR family transcriptional regulator, acetate operon repressor